MRPLFVCALILSSVLLAGCEEGPFAYIFVREDSIALANTHGNYPANWTYWGHVTLTHEDLYLKDLSDGKSKGIGIHKHQEDGSWRHLGDYRFGLFGPSEIILKEPGNYSISDLDRGGAGEGVHANVTVLTSEQGCYLHGGHRVCDYYAPPAPA